MLGLSRRIFYIPAIVYLLVFALLPFALSIYFSGLATDPTAYAALFTLPHLPEVVFNTIVFAGGTAVFATLLGMTLAILVDSRVRGKRILSLMSYIPYMIPFTASALIWTTLLDPLYGPIDYFLSAVGLAKVNWLGNLSIQIFSATIVSIWSSIPLAFLIILAGLSSVPKQVKEAAVVDGMGSYDYYGTQALPMAKGAILTAFLITLIIAFGNFDLPYILNGGLSYSMATLPFIVWFYIFFQGFISQGLAAGIILAALVSIFAILLIRVNAGRGRSGRRIPFPRIPNRLFEFVVYVVSAATLLFEVFPVYWMFLVAFRPQPLDFTTPPIVLPTKLTADGFLTTAVQSEPYLITTFAVAIVAMVITVFIAAPAAYSISRHGRKWLLVLSIYLYSLPSTTFVFGVYYIFSRANLLNTWLALFIVYPVFTIPFTIWTLSNFYDSLPRHFEEAAMVDGYSPIRSFYEIVMPLARPGLFATALISFIISWHLLLFPLVLSQTPYMYNFPPTGSFTVTLFAANFDPESLGVAVGYNIWVQLASAGIILSIPVILLSLYTQSYLLKGLYSGGTKG
jgi:multiple sugar transport system permease protein